LCGEERAAAAEQHDVPFQRGRQARSGVTLSDAAPHLGLFANLAFEPFSEHRVLSAASQ
jgi:hypothetical protein